MKDTKRGSGKRMKRMLTPAKPRASVEPEKAPEQSFDRPGSVGLLGEEYAQERAREEAALAPEQRAARAAADYLSRIYVEPELSERLRFERFARAMIASRVPHGDADRLLQRWIDSSDEDVGCAKLILYYAADLLNSRRGGLLDSGLDPDRPVPVPIRNWLADILMKKRTLPSIRNKGRPDEKTRDRAFHDCVTALCKKRPEPLRYMAPPTAPRFGGFWTPAGSLIEPKPTDSPHYALEYSRERCHLGLLKREAYQAVYDATRLMVAPDWRPMHAFVSKMPVVASWEAVKKAVEGYEKEMREREARFT